VQLGGATICRGGPGAGTRMLRRMSHQRLAGRVAIVTGASRGIGEAIARTFAREGAAVAVAARTEAVFDPRLPGTIHDTVAAIEADGGHAVAIRADLAHDDDVDLFTAVVSGLAHQQVANDPGGDRYIRQADRAVEMLLAEVGRVRRPKRRAAR